MEFEPDAGYGRLLDLEGKDLGMRINSLSQEHGEANGLESAVIDRLKVGTRVRVVPNHSCLTAPQHAFYNVVENGRVIDRWAIQRGW